MGNTHAMICRPTEGGAFRCDPVLQDSPFETALLLLFTVMVVVGIAVVGWTLWEVLNMARAEKKRQKTLDDALAGSVPERGE